jgi:antagonist of KipI
MGSEWNYLLASSGNGFLNNSFEITIESDRMGYRLAGAKLEIENSETLLSSPVAFGTIQLLPGGQMIILMADHQTTGGYAKIAHVISADLPLLAQKQPGSMIRFVLTDLADAEKAFLEQQQYLRQVRAAVLLRS